MLDISARLDPWEKQRNPPHRARDHGSVARGALIADAESKFKQIPLLDTALLGQKLVDVPSRADESAVEPRSLLAGEPDAKGAAEADIVCEVWSY
jgi:hypothetical protein